MPIHRLVVPILVATCASLAVTAAAAPVRWTLDGVRFGDGGVATGSFVYDAATNQYSNIHVTTTAGTSVAGASFNDVCSSPCTGLAPNSDGLLSLTVAPAGNLAGTPGLALVFDPPLGDRGGSSTVIGGTEATCWDATCSAPSGASRAVTQGRVIGYAFARQIPTLSEAALLMLAALLAVSTLRRLPGMRRTG